MVELPREAAVLVGACAVGAVAIAAAVSPVALVATLVSLGAATLYSARLRLQAPADRGTLVNMLIFAPLPFVGAVHLPSPGMLVLAYCFCVLVTQNQLLHEIADRHEDATGGVRTTAVVVGAAGLRVIAVLLGRWRRCCCGACRSRR
ncbi:MAG: UbiA family prenyltransferase [Candidatus Binatia bacterium]